MLLGKDALLPTSIANRKALRIKNPRDTLEAERVIEAELTKLNL